MTLLFFFSFVGCVTSQKDMGVHQNHFPAFQITINILLKKMADILQPSGILLLLNIAGFSSFREKIMDKMDSWCGWSNKSNLDYFGLV